MPLSRDASRRSRDEPEVAQLFQRGRHSRFGIEDGANLDSVEALDAEGGRRATTASSDNLDAAGRSMDWGFDQSSADLEPLFSEKMDDAIGKPNALTFNIGELGNDSSDPWFHTNDHIFDLDATLTTRPPNDFQKQSVLSLNPIPRLSHLEPSITGSLANLPSDLLTPTPVLRTGSSLIARTILGIVRSFPKMLLGDAPLPPFINHNFLSSDGHHSSCRGTKGTTHMPESLAVCASITQMHTTALPESRKFLQRTILSEQQRLHDDCRSYDKNNLVLALQACTIYLILIAFPLDAEHSQHHQPRQPWQPHLAASLLETIALIVSLLYAHGDSSNDVSVNATYLTSSKPSKTWQDWIWDESAHRVTALLYTIGFLVNISLGKSAQAACVGFDELALPAGKELWEASTGVEWELKWGRRYDGRKSGNLELSIGDLVEAYSSRRTTNAGTLDDDLRRWCEGADEFGRLINLAVMAKAAIF